MGGGGRGSRVRDKTCRSSESASAGGASSGSHGLLGKEMSLLMDVMVNTLNLKGFSVTMGTHL